MNMKWVWCEVCRCAAVICPNCGNNCCNGGSGKDCSDNCKAAYEYQNKHFDANTQPSREECDGEIPKPDWIL
jgi:hypothetical protein